MKLNTQNIMLAMTQTHNEPLPGPGVHKEATGEIFTAYY